MNEAASTAAASATSIPPIAILIALVIIAVVLVWLLVEHKITLPATLQTKFDSIESKLGLIHAAAIAPVSVTSIPAAPPPPPAPAAPAPGAGGGSQAAPPAAAAVAASLPVQHVDPRTIPGGTAAYDSKLYPARGSGLAAWKAAGSPYADINGFQLDVVGFPTGFLSDGATPVPGGAFDAAGPTVWNAALFANCGWWFGFSAPGSYEFALKAGSYAVATTARGNVTDVQVTLTDKSTGAALSVNGDTFTVHDTTCTLTVAGNGTVQLMKR